MTDNTQADDAMKAMEENPERYDSSPDTDSEVEQPNRHRGSVSTNLGGESVSSLISKV